MNRLSGVVPRKFPFGEINMKKTLLATSLAAAMSVATTADAAFSGGDGNYRITITGGCFAFDNCQVTGSGTLTDNTTANQADTSALGTTTTYGSGITNDGLMGVIDFTLTSGNISVTSYSQDSYLGTAGGTFYLRAGDMTTMGGTIAGSGAMSFDPTGRMGLAAGYLTTLGEQEWNRDDTSNGLGSGVYDTWTTGTSTNRTQGFTGGFTVTGSNLASAGTSQWSGTLVSAGNIGAGWGGFDNQQYSEIFNITILLIDPVANDDPISASAGAAKTINITADLLSNDTHTLNEALTLDSFTQPGGTGTLVDNGNGTLTYTPDATLVDGDTDSFTYIISDASGRLSAPATVNITITSNVAPTANADNETTVEDTPVTFDPVANDTDPTDALSIAGFDPFSAQGGTIVAATANFITYTPAENYNGGPDTFNYQVTDGINTVTGQVNITVTAVNDAPVCSDVALSTGVDLPLSISVTNDLLLTTGSNPLCVDVEGNSVSLATFDTTGDKGGTLADNGAGTLTYTPAPGFQGDEKFSFTATDGQAANAVAAVNELVITVGALKSNFTMMDQTGLTFGGTNDVEFVWDETTFNDSVTVNANGIPTDTDFSIITISSPFPFFNANWFAHNIRIFKNTTGAEITLNFDITCQRSDYDATPAKVDCGGNPANEYMTLTLQPGEIGAHILFDWGETGKPTPCGQAACDIDVVNKWEENGVWNDPDGPTSGSNNLWLGAKGIAPAVDTTWRLVSTDVNGDGINGTPMLDGPFIDNYANFNYKPAGAGESLPPYTGSIEDVSVDSLAFSMGWWSLLAGLLPVFGLRRINNKK